MSRELLINHDEDARAGARLLFPVSEAETRDGLGAAPASLRALAEFNGFAGEAGAVLAGEEGVLVGLGDGRDPFALAAAADRLPAGDYALAGDVAPLQLLAWRLGGYRFDRYKKPSRTGNPNQTGAGRRPAARLVAPQSADVEAAHRIADGVFLARDLVNTPASDMLPDRLEKAARDLAAEFGAEISVIAGDALLDRNFPMIHAVGRASAVAPRLIDFTWGRAEDPKLTIVGKGVCFDSGGLNIKPSGAMALMKKDMGGAANALGLARMIMSAGLRARLRVLIPAVENAISGSAFRPGDVLPSRKGLSVEIGNTDAEGRLVLADAMTYGGEEAPDVMITLATLTGAARVALGPELAPFYCDDERFAGEIVDAAQSVCDPVWRMPLWVPYNAMLASPVADMNNAPSGGFAGSVLAGLFLKRFAPADAVWAHFDIYAWRPKAQPGRPVGGEAQGIRALFEAFQKRAA